jgi:hypothetical protein
MSPRKVISGVLFLLALGGVFLAGLAIGHRRTFDWMNEAMATQTQGELALLLDSLVLIRAGRTDGAVERMETRTGWATMALTGGRRWDEIPAGRRHALLVAKKYFQAYPPAVMEPRLQAALAAIPEKPLDPSACGLAGRELLRAGRTR